MMKVKVSQSCPTLCNPMDYIVHGILQARILEWVAVPFSRGSFQPRDWTQVSCITADSLPAEPTGKPKNTGVVAYPFSRISSWPRNWTRVSCPAGGFFTSWATREALAWWSQSYLEEAHVAKDHSESGPQSYNHKAMKSANKWNEVRK